MVFTFTFVFEVMVTLSVTFELSSYRGVNVGRQASHCLRMGRDGRGDAFFCQKSHMFMLTGITKYNI